MRPALLGGQVLPLPVEVVFEAGEGFGQRLAQFLEPRLVGDLVGAVGKPVDTFCGVRTKTFSSATLSAMVWITWMPVAPMPTTPTRFPQGRCPRWASERYGRSGP